ncbi:MAG: glycosyltransferase 87 family protein, partial [Christensenellaceae bacterium]
VLVFLFLYLYRSERAWVREIGILALSAAGVCKYYPLILGVILLKKKDFFGAIRCAIYCVLLFLLPFLFYEGGLKNLPLFLRNLGYFVGGENRLAEGGNFSIWSLVYRLLSLFGVTDATALSAVCAVGTAAAFVAMTSIAFLTKDMFTESMMFVAVMTLVPPVSYYYLVVFLILPVLVMVRDWQKMGRRKYFYAVFFSICAFLPTTALPTHVVQALCFVAAIVIEWIHYLKNKHQKERI